MKLKEKLLDDKKVRIFLSEVKRHTELYPPIEIPVAPSGTLGLSFFTCSMTSDRSSELAAQ